MPASKPGSPGRILLVLGMHRSGTSLLSGLLSNAGLDLGKSIMEAAEDNPSGFHENARIVALHEQLLNSLGQTWSSFAELPEGWQQSEDVEAFRSELKALLEEEFDGERPLCIKDPRLCRLLPLWRDLCKELQVDLACASIVRPAPEVVASLAKRDSLGQAHGRALWLRYNLDMIAHCEGIPLYRTSYETVMQEPERVLGELADTCGLTLASADVGLVNPALRHHKENLPNDASTSLYELLSAGHKEVPAWYAADLLPLAEQLAQLESDLSRQSVEPESLSEEALASARERQLFEQAQDAKQYAGSMERELETGRSYIVAMEQELEERQAYASSLEQEMAARDADIETKAEFIESLEAEMKHREAFTESELKALRADLEERARYVESLSTAVEQKDSELASLQAALHEERAGHEEFVAAHEEDVARREAYAQSLNAELESKSAYIAELEHRFRFFIRLSRILKGQSGKHE